MAALKTLIEIQFLLKSIKLDLTMIHSKPLNKAYGTISFWTHQPFCVTLV